MSSHDDGDPDTIQTIVTENEGYRKALDDRGLFFCFFGLIIIFIATSWWLGLTEAFTIVGTGLFIFGLVSILSK
jgi:uncharacterized membrane protein